MEKRQITNDEVSLGLSGVVLPYPKYKFPAEFQNLSRLSIYATYFNSIEVNDSFYKVPQRKTLERWCTMVPDNFKFTFKLHQDVTHCKFLKYDAGLITKFFDTLSVVGKKNACILVQFPPSLKSDAIAQLENLLQDMKESLASSRWNIAVEFRDASWYNDDTFDLLHSHDVSLVLQDIPKSATPFITTSHDFVYVRFHGPTGTYRGSYSEAFLMEYAQYIHDWRNDGKKVFVYFNNTAGAAFENAVALGRILKTIEK